MSNAQLYLAIGIPLLFNAALLVLLQERRRTLAELADVLEALLARLKSIEEKL